MAWERIYKFEDLEHATRFKDAARQRLPIMFSFRFPLVVPVEHLVQISGPVAPKQNLDLMAATFGGTIPMRYLLRIPEPQSSEKT